MAKERAERSAVEREPCREKGRMLLRVTPIRLRVEDDEPHAHRRRVKATFRGERPGKSCLAIQRPEDFVHIDELGLEFNDQQVSSLRVPGQLIDDAALSVDRERGFGINGPAGTGAAC
jgi:hypothetical protein